MAVPRKTASKNDKANAKRPRSRSVEIASAGIHTGEQFARLMSALMSDIITGDVTPQAANATCNAGGKLLKVVEMQYKYGSGKGGARSLSLTSEKPL